MTSEPMEFELEVLPVAESEYIEKKTMGEEGLQGLKDRLHYSQWGAYSDYNRQVKVMEEDIRVSKHHGKYDLSQTDDPIKHAAKLLQAGENALRDAGQRQMQMLLKHMPNPLFVLIETTEEPFPQDRDYGWEPIRMTILDHHKGQIIYDEYFFPKLGAIHVHREPHGITIDMVASYKELADCEPIAILKERYGEYFTPVVYSKWEYEQIKEDVSRLFWGRPVQFLKDIVDTYYAEWLKYHEVLTRQGIAIDHLVEARARLFQIRRVAMNVAEGMPVYVGPTIEIPTTTNVNDFMMDAPGDDLDDHPF